MRCVSERMDNDCLVGVKGSHFRNQEASFRFKRFSANTISQRDISEQMEARWGGGGGKWEGCQNVEKELEIGTPMGIENTSKPVAEKQPTPPP